jgi:hypothetical protein
MTEIKCNQCESHIKKCPFMYNPAECHNVHESIRRMMKAEGQIIDTNFDFICPKYNLKYPSDAAGQKL